MRYKYSSRSSTYASRRRARVGVALVAALAGWLAASDARAQACCGTTGSGEFGVVGRSQLASVASQLSYERGFGSFDASGRFSSLRGVRVNDAVFALGAGYRLFSPLQLHASLPLRVQSRDIDSLGSSTAVGPADATVGIRADIVEEGHVGRLVGAPFVQLGALLTVPTGTTPEESEDVTGADMTSDGSWGVSPLVRVSKTVSERDTLELRGAYLVRLPREVTATTGESRRLRAPHEAQLYAGYTRTHGLFWLWGVHVDFRAGSQAQEDGAGVADSETRRTRAGARVVHYVGYPNWALSAALVSDLPLDGLDANVPFAGTTLSLGLEWAAMR